MSDLELFDNQKTFQITKEKLESSFFDVIDAIECKHEQKEIFPDKSGYCIECGYTFNSTDDIQIGECKHENKYEDDCGLYICKDCKKEFDIKNFDQEWKYYSDNGAQSSKDPSRCHKILPTGKSIEKVFTDVGWELPKAIVLQVESKYNKIVGDQTIRGKKRKSIIAACLLFAYREFSEHRTADFIRNIFGLTKKEMSTGLTSYYSAFPEDRTVVIKPENLLKWVLTLVGIDQSHHRKILHICRYVEKASFELKRRSPQLVIASVVYFYVCLNPSLKQSLGLTKNKFAEKVQLSDGTIAELAKETARICGIAVGM